MSTTRVASPSSFARRTRAVPFARRSRGAVRASGAARDDDDDVPTSSESTDDGARLERWRARARAMRVKTLKERLSSMNLRHDDCLEKSELVDRAARAWLTRAENRAARLPLRQLGNAGGMSPRSGYAVVTLDVGGEIGLCDFVIDTGATTALITPKVLEMLDAGRVREGAAVRGLTGTGETLRQKVTVTEARLGSETFDLDAVVTDLSAVGLPPTIGGLLGLDWLGKYEVEFDFSASTITFWPRGSVSWGALDVDELVRVTLGTHKVGLKTVRCTLNDAAPVDAIVDMGSFFSVVNWMASAAAGVGPDSPSVKSGGLQVSGVDGNNVSMSMAPYDLRVLGDDEDLDSVYRGMCCVGDLPAFNALGASVSPFMALGLDVIGRGRMVFDASESVMYLAKGDVGYGT